MLSSDVVEEISGRAHTRLITGVVVASTGVFAAQAAASSHIGHAAASARSAASGLYVACYYLGGSVGATALVVPWKWGGWSAVVMSIIVVQVALLFITQKYFARIPSHTQPIPIE